LLSNRQSKIGNRQYFHPSSLLYGQLVLLPDQDVLLELSEKGELVLVKASPDQFIELARFPVLEGKTWNHPVLVGDIAVLLSGRTNVSGVERSTVSRGLGENEIRQEENQKHHGFHRTCLTFRKDNEDVLAS
jgi:hypothetical protein